VNAAYPLDDADRLADLRRQSRLELRDLEYDGHDCRAGVARQKREMANRNKRRTGRRWTKLIWLR
jgi:hypothetical protein